MFSSHFPISQRKKKKPFLSHFQNPIWEIATIDDCYYFRARRPKIRYPNPLILVYFSANNLRIKSEICISIFQKTILRNFEEFLFSKKSNLTQFWKHINSKIQKILRKRWTLSISFQFYFLRYTCNFWSAKKKNNQNMFLIIINCH